MIEITGAYPPERRLECGDVVVIKRRLTDKKTKKPFDWRFFGLVLKVVQVGFRFVILDGREDRGPQAFFFHELREALGDDATQLWYLPESQWPDGVHAFRTRLILEGRIEGTERMT